MSSWPVVTSQGCAAESMAAIEVKRGDAYNLPVFVLDPATGANLSTVGCALRCTIRSASGSVVSSSSMIVIDALTGAYAVPFSGTTAWPLGDALADIEITWPDAVVEHSATFIVRVLESQTL